MQEGRPKHLVVMDLMRTVASSPSVRYLLWMECFALVTRPQQNFPFHGKYERLGKLIMMWVAAAPPPPPPPRALCMPTSTCAHFAWLATHDAAYEAHDDLCGAHITDLHAELRPLPVIQRGQPHKIGRALICGGC